MNVACPALAGSANQIPGDDEQFATCKDTYPIP